MTKLNKTKQTRELRTRNEGEISIAGFPRSSLIFTHNTTRQPSASASRESDNLESF